MAIRTAQRPIMDVMSMMGVGGIRRIENSFGFFRNVSSIQSLTYLSVPKNYSVEGGEEYTVGKPILGCF
jgi:hypothetical protein